MLNRAAATAISFFFVTSLFAQAPAPSSAPAKGSAPKSPIPNVSPTPSPVPTTQEIINSLGEKDLQAAISLFKSNFANPDAITDMELNRAMVAGLLVRMPGGLILLPNRESAAEPVEPFYSEIFEGHIGYLRLGSLNGANLKEMDKALQNFTSKKVDALIVDLRDSSSGDFATASEFAKRFCPKGKTLFSLRKQGVRQDRSFSSDRDPAFQGLVVVLADGDTAGGAETVAAALKLYDKALLIGQATAGRAVEYSDSPLPSGKILRVASAEAVMPDDQPLYPGGVKPDLPVEMNLADKQQIFRQSEKGMSPFVYENDRPHLNEAALIAGTNPELEVSDAQRRNRTREKSSPRDSVLQRALDVVTSLEIYQKR